jgi:molecular chaperone HscB
VICWSCEREAGAGPFCGACQALLPPAEGTDHFAVLGVPRRYGIDLAEAEGAYQKLSRRLHPDRFATADPRARRASLAHTVQLNQAWRTLKDPVRRAEYLLELAGVDVAGDDQKPSAGAQRETRKVAVPPAFLMEILELHDDFGEARRGGDAAKVAALTEEMRGRAAEAMKTISAALDTGSTAAPEAARLDEAARALIALRYYRRFLDEAEAHEEGAARSAGSQMSEAGPRGG